MPIEYALLKDEPPPLLACPRDGHRSLRPFIRGQVQSTWRRWLGLPYCAVICEKCKDIIGWEKPPRHPTPPAGSET